MFRKMATLLIVTSIMLTYVLTVGAEITGNTQDGATDEAVGSILLGATTLDGSNYQQIGFRLDLPLGKLGFGLDIQLLIDEEGSIREEDWDEAEDYLDLIYYIRWDKKGAPFYAKVGGLDFTYLGYNDIVNGYTNMINYPDLKRLGMEMSLKTEMIEGEFFLNDLKEGFEKNPSVVYGARVAYRILGGIAMGATIAGDLNEFNGLRDADGDDYADEVDRYPYNDALATEYEYYVESRGISEAAFNEFVAIGEYDGTRRADIDRKSDLESSLTIWGLDIGYPIIDGETIKVDLYAAYSNIVDYGWGITAPGFRVSVGDFFSFTAEYKIQSKEFMFGYFNNTYELERAYYVNESGTLKPHTRQERLLAITDDMQGYLVGARFDMGDLISFDAQYQDMSGDTVEDINSLTGEVVVNDGAYSIFPTVRGYYVQNNVEDFDEWRTESTIAGYVLEFAVGDVTMGIDHQFTFEDMNGNGLIDGDDETIRTISLFARIVF